jgi:hypothetical protein
MATVVQLSCFCVLVFAFLLNASILVLSGAAFYYGSAQHRWAVVQLLPLVQQRRAQLGVRLLWSCGCGVRAVFCHTPDSSRFRVCLPS